MSENTFTNLIGQLEKIEKKNEDKKGDSLKRQTPLTNADKIIKIMSKYDLYKDDSGIIYFNKYIDSKKLTFRADDKYLDIFATDYFDEFSETVSQKIRNTVKSMIIERASKSTDVRKVYTRVANIDNKIYIDLFDCKDTVIEIDKDGYRTSSRTDINFLRPRGMMPLPYPQTGGNFYEFIETLNLSSDDDRKLLTAYIPALFLTEAPRAAMFFIGFQGSGKSTTVKFIRRLDRDRVFLDTNLGDSGGR